MAHIGEIIKTFVLLIEIPERRHLQDLGCIKVRNASVKQQNPYARDSLK